MEDGWYTFSILERNEHWNKAAINIAFNYRHTAALHNGRNMEIHNKHKTFEVSGKKELLKARFA